MPSQPRQRRLSLWQLPTPPIVMRKTLDPNASQVPNESRRGENASERDEASTSSNTPLMPDFNETPNANRARGDGEGEESGREGLTRSRTEDFRARVSGVDRSFVKGGTKGEEQSMSKRAGAVIQTASDLTRSLTEGMRKMYNSHKGSGKTSDSHPIHESNSRHNRSFRKTLEKSHSERSSHSEQDKNFRKTPEKSYSGHGNQKKTPNPPPVPPKNTYREPTDPPPPPPPPPKHRDQQKHPGATKHDNHQRPSEAPAYGQDTPPDPPVIVIG